MTKLCTIFAAGAFAVAAAFALSFSVSAARAAGPPVVVEQPTKLAAFTDLGALSVYHLAVANTVDLKVVPPALGDGGSVIAPPRSGLRLVEVDHGIVVGGSDRPAMWPPIAA